MNNIAILLFALSVVGCHQYKNKDQSEEKTDTTLAAKREIPLTRFSDTIIAYKAMRKIEKDLGLDRLVYGYDSVQFRILLTFSLTPERQLIIISHRGGAWKAEVLDLHALSTSDTTITFEVSNRKIVSPLSGWPTFIKQIDVLGIGNLPDYRTLPKYYYNTDENLAAIEIATSDFYKIVSYPARSTKRDVTPQEAQLEQILQYLEKELNFKRYKRPENK